MTHLCTSKKICSPNSEYLYLASIHIEEFLFFRDREGGLLPVDTEGDSQGNCETWGCPQKSEKGGSRCRIVEQEVEELMKFCTNYQFCTLIDLSAACINSLPTEFIRTSALSVYVDDQYFGTATPKSQPLSSICHEICKWWDGWVETRKQKSEILHHCIISFHIQLINVLQIMQFMCFENFSWSIGFLLLLLDFVALMMMMMRMSSFDVWQIWVQ